MFLIVLPQSLIKFSPSSVNVHTICLIGGIMLNCVGFFYFKISSSFFFFPLLVDPMLLPLCRPSDWSWDSLFHNMSSTPSPKDPHDSNTTHLMDSSTSTITIVTFDCRICRRQQHDNHLIFAAATSDLHHLRLHLPSSPLALRRRLKGIATLVLEQGESWMHSGLN